MPNIWDASYSAVNGKKPRKSDKQYEGEDVAANARNAAGLLADFTPVVGGVKGAYEEAKAGNPLMSMINALTVPADVMSAGMGGAALKAGLLGTFIGKGAKTWDAVKAAEVSKRLASGEDAAKVWQESGAIGRAPWDKELRGEVADNKSFYRGSKAAGSSYAEDVMLHPDLYGNYSGLGSHRVIESNAPGGSYDAQLGRITVGPIDANSTMLHELQHAIQGREGWAKGGTPGSNGKTWEEVNAIAGDIYKNSRNDYGDPLLAELFSGTESLKPWESMSKIERIPYIEQANTSIYDRLAGEAEARLTQHRMNLTPQERLDQYPYDPEYFKNATGVNINDLIVRGLLE